MLKFFPFEELGRRSLPMERKKKEWKKKKKKCVEDGWQQYGRK